MTSVKKLSRREFFQFTGKSGAALALMASLPVSSGRADVLNEAQGLSLNLFVSMDLDGQVEIIAHRSEMGTGIRTSLPQVVADEMEADWSRVTVVQGLANADYGSQNTDGSRSVRDFFDVMRVMGASARRLLEQAAAQKWSVALESVKAERHQVVHADSGRGFDFKELVEAAAKLPMPDAKQLKLKSDKEFKYIGKDVASVDLMDICTGNTTFGIDVELPDLLHASIERTPVLDGRVKSFDAKAAKKVAGVVDVIEIKATPLPAHFHPMAGVAVLADSSYAAVQGRNALNVKWNSGANGSYNSDQHLKQLADRVTNQSGEVFRNRGNAEKGLQASSQVIDATYVTPYLAHASMEPPMATARVTAQGCEVWACTQTPQATQKAVAAALGVDESQVTVHVTLLGGGFGRKSKPDFSVEAALLAKQVGRPVKVTWSREDDIHNDYFHSCAAQYFKAGINDDGRVTSWLAREAVPPIMSTFVEGADMMNDGALSQTFGAVPFEVENLQLERLPAEPHVRIGWLRSVYNIPFCFGVASFVDELAHAAGKNARDFWLELIGSDRQLDFASEGFELSNYGRSLKDFPYDTARLKNVIRQLTDSIPWNESLPKGEGWGLAVCKSFLSYVAVASKVRVESGKLSVTEMHCVIDCGRVVNPDRVHAQLEGAMIFGLSLALNGEISFVDGASKQSNFHDYPVARINQTPAVIKTHIVESTESPAGVGEPGVPAVAPSLTNAIFAATGQRIRELPLNKQLTV